VLKLIYNPNQGHTLPTGTIGSEAFLLTHRLLAGYKMYPGVEYSLKILAGIE
jgi:hypothetical protein